MARLLFLCLHNACRSRIAAAIAAKEAPAGWTIASAGAAPSERTDPKAAAVLRRHGLSMGPEAPKDVSALADRSWDCVVSMGCGDAGAGVAARTRAEWIIPDPYDGPAEVYEALYEELRGRVLRLISVMSDAD